MAEWATFVGLTGVVLVCLLVLSHLTSRAFRDGAAPPDDADTDTVPEVSEVPADVDRSDTTGTTGTTDGSDVPDPTAVSNVTTEQTPQPTATHPVDHDHHPARQQPPESLSTGALLANVALSQGVFATILIAAAFYTQIPPRALGITLDMNAVVTAIGLGTALGIGLYIANELGAAGAKRFGIDHDEELRSLLAPSSRGGWLILLTVVLPMIAVFEEFLFRAALVGVFSAWAGLSPWLFAVCSSVFFALGHGMQGPAGIVVTGALGFVLAAIFILTGSLLVVVIAHYLINALEFIVHEGLDIEWTERIGIEAEAEK